MIIGGKIIAGILTAAVMPAGSSGQSQRHRRKLPDNRKNKTAGDMQ